MLPSSTRRLQIAIVGYGVAGATAAGLLARAGHAVHRFDSAPGRGGAGLLLQPLGLTVLERLGLLDAAMACGARIDRMLGEQGSGKVVMQLDFSRCNPPGFALGLQRAALADLLRSADPGASEIIPAHVLAVDAQAGTLRDAQGRDYGSFDLIIASDGAGSALRSALPLRTREMRYRWGAWLLLLEDPQRKFDGQLWQRHARDRQLAVWPVGSRAAGETPRVNLSWRVDMATHADPARHGVDAFKREVTAHDPRVAPLLARIDDLQPVICAGYRAIATDRCVHGRVVLLGDAAHAMSPVLGQGASLALLDAWQLARSLQLAGGEVNVATARFAQARRRHVRTYQRMSRWLTPLLLSGHALPSWLREHALPRLQRLPGFAGAMHRSASGTQLGLFSTLRDPLD